MAILALDLSLLNTGIAIFNDAGECIHLESIDTKKEETYPLKLKHIEKVFKELKKDYSISVVVVEESFTRFNKSTQAIYRVRAIAELVFYKLNFICYHSTSIRKELLGHGNAKKEEVQNYIKNIYPNIKFKDFDQSDAFAVGLCYLKRRENINGS